VRSGAQAREALVIEDEQPIRDLLVRLLGRRDYRVTEAASCREAKAASDGRQFDLVLCDVRLEDGNGAECLRHLMERQPAIGRRFVFVTGDIAALADQAGEFAGVPVLTKPFTVTDLDRVLGDVEVGV
jgi:CheY-like chemotaxis protein